MAAHPPDFPKRWFCTCPKCQTIIEVPNPYVLADCRNCNAPLDLVKKHSIPDERDPGTRITEAPVEEHYYEPEPIKLSVDDRKFLVGLKIARF